MAFELRFMNVPVGGTEELNHVASISIRGNCTISNEHGESRTYPNGFVAQSNFRDPIQKFTVQAHENLEIDYMTYTNT